MRPKQQAFIKEYLIDLNATKAAIRAGYSEKWAGTNADKLLKNTKIAAAIQKAMDERANKLDITAERVLQEIAKLAFGNIKNVYAANGQLIAPQELPEDVSATITEVTEKQLGGSDGPVLVERKYKIADKKSSLELLGKHLKLFTDKLEHTGENGKPLFGSLDEFYKALARK